MPVITLNQVISTSIDAERLAEALFRRLQAGFAHAPAVAGYWGRFAEDEARHAAWITGLRARLDRETLSRPVDAVLARMVKQIAGVSLDQALVGVNDLEDAYRLADTLEHSETNAIFEFLITHFEPDPQMRRFMQEQVEKHVAALTDYIPDPYQTPEARRSLPFAPAGNAA